MTTRNKEIVVAFIDAVWTRGDIDACDGYLAPRYTIHHDPGDPWEGRTLDAAGFKERVRRSRAPFPDQRFTIVDVVAENDRVVVAWTWAGTHADDLPGIPATGRSVAMSGVTVYFMEGERIAGHWQVADRLSVYRQLRQP